MERLDLYKCQICGNLVEVILSGSGELVCCGQPMEKIEPQTHEQAFMEKHVPIFIETENGEEIRVGEVLHPMIEEHHIMFIEAISRDRNRALLQYYYPGDIPKMFTDEKFVKAREYCNIHGLWEGEKK